MHDQVDDVGQPLPRQLVQTQVRFPDVAGEDLQVLRGQVLEVPEQFGVAAVESLVEPLPRHVRGAAPRRCRSACRPSAPAVPAIPGTGNDRDSRSPRSAGRCARAPRGRGSVLASASVVASMNLSSVRSPARTSVLPVPCTAGERRSFRSGLERPSRCGSPTAARSFAGLMTTPTGTSTSKISLQQAGERQRGQRVAAQVGEVRVVAQRVRRAAEQRLGRPARRCRTPAGHDRRDAARAILSSPVRRARRTVRSRRSP